MSERGRSALRRLVSIPAYAVLFVASLALLPLSLPLGALADLLGRRRFAITRSLLFFSWYLGCELAGIGASAVLFTLRPALSDDAWTDWHHRLQGWWAGALWGGAETLFGLHIELEGTLPTPEQPLLVFMRHASVADTLLPALLLSSRRGLRLRYVLKRELLWDPCLDIVGNRLPNIFVRRSSDDSAREIAAVSRLATGLSPGEGVLIYPEGTRFDEQKRARILTRIEAGGDADLLRRARQLRHVLPPRLGGPLALLDGAAGADVVFCAHTGLEAATRFSTFLRGGLVGATVRVVFWRVARGDVPADGDARIEWLFDQWSRVDAWIDVNRKESPA